MDVSEVKVLARRANGILFVIPVLMLLSGFALVYSILVLNDVIEPDKETLYIIYIFSLFGTRRYARRHFNRVWDYEFTYHYSDFEKNFIENGRFGYIETFGTNPMSSFELILWGCIFAYSFYLLVFICIFLQRLFTPRTIMEYDDFGLYIYQRGKPVTLLRYKEIWSTYTEEDFENVEFCYHRGFYRVRNIRVSEPLWGMIKTGSIRIETPDDFINLGGIYHVKAVERDLKRMIKIKRQQFVDELEENIKENQRLRDLEELAKHNPNT